MAQKYDLVIIGLGSGGTLAAEFAAQELGLKVAAVERQRIGGDCLWTGCVPSKSLIASARVAHTVRTAARFGITAPEPSVDLAAVWGRIKTVQASIAATDDSPDRFRDMGVDLIFGTGRVTGSREVTVRLDPSADDQSPDRSGSDDVVLSTRYTLVCTGSRPSVPPIEGIAEIDYLTSENLFELDRPPASLVMIGGGPIAVEMAQALVRLGVPTTVFEMAHRLLPRDEPELAERLTTVLRGEGVTIHLDATVDSVEQGGDGVIVRSGQTDATGHGLLVAAGRRANVESLGLDKFGIQADAGGVAVDGRSRTIVPSIYVVGDAAAERARFTHLAAYDAVMAVRDMFFPGRGRSAPFVPWCTFTEPEVAHAGLTAAAAREKFGSRSVTVHRHELAHNDRARADGTTEGAIMVITAKDRIVGAHALAPNAGELIHELALAVRFELKLSDLADLVHIYPTLSTGISQLVAEQSFKTGRKYRALTKLSRWLG